MLRPRAAAVLIGWAVATGCPSVVVGQSLVPAPPGVPPQVGPPVEYWTAAEPPPGVGGFRPGESFVPAVPPQEFTPYPPPGAALPGEPWPGAVPPEAVDPAWAFEPQPPPVAPPAKRDLLTGVAGDDRSPVVLGGTWLPGRPVEGQGTDLTLWHARATLAYPLYLAEDGRSMWLATSSFRYWQLDTGAVLPDSQQRMPGELWRIEAGSLLVRELENCWQVGGLFTAGTATDEPFASIREMTLTTLAFVNIPRGPRDAWNLSLMYSPTSPLPYPIPGAAYVWRPHDRLMAQLGLPFALRYQPSDLWTFSASYRPLTAVQAKAARALGTQWSLYARYEMVNDSFFLADRTSDGDQLFLFDQRAALGLERTLPAGLRLDVSTAYVFDRRIFQSESFFTDRRDLVEIDPGLAVGLLLRWSR